MSYVACSKLCTMLRGTARREMGVMRGRETTNRRGQRMIRTQLQGRGLSKQVDLAHQGAPPLVPGVAGEVAGRGQGGAEVGEEGEEERREQLPPLMGKAIETLPCCASFRSSAAAVLTV
jgi:hypothetical protein